MDPIISSAAPVSKPPAAAAAGPWQAHGPAADVDGLDYGVGVGSAVGSAGTGVAGTSSCDCCASGR